MQTDKRFLFTLAIFVMAGAAQARVLIDMQFTDSARQTGAAVVGSTEDQWNTSDKDNGTLALKNVAGADTGVSLTWSGGGLFGYSTANAFHGTDYEPLMTHYLYSANSQITTLSFAGLNKASTYNLYLYTDSDTSGRQAEFTVTGSTTSGPTTAVSDSRVDTFVPKTNYVEFLGLAPDKDGNLSVSCVGVEGDKNEADLNGFQIQEVTK